MKMEIDVFCILQNIVYGYFLITSFYIQLLLLIPCLLYTSDAADDTPCVDLGGRRIIKSLFHSDGILRFP